MKKKLADLRNDYGEIPLLEQNLPANPVELFQAWLDTAIQSNLYEPNAMVLSTLDQDFQPDSRVVLLKGIVDGKLVFFTNYSSAKGKQLEINKKVSVIFFWKELHRQIRIQGIVEKSPARESQEYFSSRPRESQLGARASKQSAVIKDRASLEAAFSRERDNFENIEIPRPENWGGYRIIPVKIEFWQGRSGRMHDRLVYHLEKKSWKVQRLAP